jgi:hypothetical protein
MKKIIFVPDNDKVVSLYGLPKPAKKTVPDWYKKTPKFYQETDKVSGLNFFDSGTTNSTIKGCVPFLDAITAGYIWELPVDLEFRKTDGITEIKWRYGGPDYISSHSNIQVEFMPVPEPSKDSSVFKFKFEYQIKTPKGYSTLFTHPLNNHNLIFRTFSGIVDTDKYNLSVQFPFQVHADFGDHLIVPKGTPVIQFIPFKRDDWTHEVEEFNPDTFEKRKYDFFSKISNSYKSQFWQRKNYS